MRPYILTVFIFILTHNGAFASDGKDEDSLAKYDMRSSKYLGQVPIGHKSPQDDERVRDSYSRNNGRVRFEDNPSKSPDKPNFFPIDESTNTGNADKGEAETETSLYDDISDDNDSNLEDIEDEQKIFTKFEDTYNKEIADASKDTSDADRNKLNGYVVFEDDNKELVRKKKRKPRRRPENNILETPNTSYGVDYTGYQGPVNSQHSVSHTKRPRHYPYQTGHAGSYAPGLYPGHQVATGGERQEPPRKIKNSVANSGHNTSDNTKYTNQHSGETNGVKRPVDYRQEYAGAAYSGYLPGFSGAGGGNGNVAVPNSQQGQYGLHPGGYHQYPVAGPRRRPKSLTQQAVSAVAEALTSIALFDDKQCVPRLLCEAASGRTAGSPMILKATAGIGPLLSILQSYNAASSSPLFIFGRAAVLGVTSVGNTVACHRAYPQCPNDPTELIKYLNNHNGGFFRFFGQPERPQKQQNVEQFYNHLAGQTGYQLQNQQQTQQHIQTYAGYGNQNLYPKSNEPNYDEEDTTTNSKFLDIETSSSEIQERIQNKPGIDIIAEENADDEQFSKWTFPDEADNKNKVRKPRRPRKQKTTNTYTTERLPRGERGGSPLKFPDDRGFTEDRPNIERERDSIRTQKLIFFQNDNNLDSESNYQTNTAVIPEDYVFDYRHNFYVKRPKQITNTINKDEAQILYIVRGNGDPNRPEIVRVKPGQSI